MAMFSLTVLHTRFDSETSTAQRFTAAKTTTVASTSSRLEAAATWEIHSLLAESWQNIGL
jgi:hypothetical protein